MKKIILLLLFTTVSFAQNTEADKELKFNSDLKLRLEEFKKTNVATEEIRTLLIGVAENISKAATDPTLIKEAKDYLELVKNQNLVRNKQSDLSKLPAELLSKFNYYTDKFSLITFITHKKSDNLYIGVKNDIPYLKFKITYRGNDWVFVKKITFLIDGQPFEYRPINIKRDVVLGSGVKETIEDDVDKNSFPLLNAIANATDDIQVRFEGDRVVDQTYYKKRISLPFKEILELYNSFK